MHPSFFKIKEIRDRVLEESLKQIDVVDVGSFKEYLEQRARDLRILITDKTPESEEMRDSIIELGVTLHTITMIRYVERYNNDYPPKGDYLLGSRGVGTGFSSSLHYTEKKGFYEIRQLYGKKEGEEVIMSPADIKKTGVEIGFLKFYMQVQYQINANPPSYSGETSLSKRVSQRLQINSNDLRNLNRWIEPSDQEDTALKPLQDRKEYLEYLCLNDLALYMKESEKIDTLCKDMNREERIALILTY